MSVAACRPLPVLLILGTLAGCKEAPPPPPPPPEVVVQPVDVRDTPVQAEFTGEIRGGEDVEVRARVAGYLQKPYTSKQLAEKVKAVLKGAGVVREEAGVTNQESECRN